MPRKLLIANRGEITCRIIRTAREMGIKTVAVFSDADANAQHRLIADEAVHIGPAAVSQSYLSAEKILTAALDTGADAIHPGYGFLSENPDFVETVERSGITFVGPSASAIRSMGLKDAAKKLMEEAGVPVVPGYHGDMQDSRFLAAKANEIGYPVLIKARAGGGGKGMRRVDEPNAFSAALAACKSEAKSSFGDSRVLIEKYIQSPRHIEIQIFGDNHGNIVHLFERDCSLQRRYQKVIEEAPAPGMTEKMRSAMGNAAIKAAQAINYSGAGTVEFIVDGLGGLNPEHFWFMEMNTRLQVEHPVTEAITGVDLVAWQLRVANDEYLPKLQDELTISGHAFEARLYAEDVSRGFLPATGKLEHLEFSANARIDSGVIQGDVITPHYDPMIAKIIVHSDKRETALSALESALSETRIAGTVTNATFLRALCSHDGFARGDVDTGLIDRDIELLSQMPPPTDAIVALAANHVLGLPALPLQFGDKLAETFNDPFAVPNGFSIWAAPVWTCHLLFGEIVYEVRINPHGQLWQYRVGDGDEFDLPSTDFECGKPVRFGDRVVIFSREGSYEFVIQDTLAGKASDMTGGDLITAPMPGLVHSIAADAGQRVSRGDVILTLEAMKMEHTLTAPRDGIIEEVLVSQGNQVEDGDILIALEKSDA